MIKDMKYSEVSFWFSAILASTYIISSLAPYNPIFWLVRSSSPWMICVLTNLS
jgi:hypothetical protein